MGLGVSSSYRGKDGWTTESPVKEISDPYVQRKFVEQARLMLSDLERFYLAGSRIPLDDNDPAKNHHGQGRWVADNHNPSWYSELYWAYRYRRPGPFKRKYGSRRQPKYRQVSNKAYSDVRKYNSLIRKDRIKKFLEQIVGGEDIKLRPRIEKVKRRFREGSKGYVIVEKRMNHDIGSYVTLLRETIAQRLVEGYALEGEDTDPRFNYCPPDNKVRKYFGKKMLSRKELWELSGGH